MIGGERSHSGRSGTGAWIRRVGCVLLFTMLAWQWMSVVAAGTSRDLMFDGGMNLEVSRSIAEGNGPRRMYDFREVFPPGVQSKEPLVLLGALSFKVFGVGPLQAQLPNLLYFTLATVLVVLVIRRTADLASALMAAVFSLAVPEMSQYAIGGYGEIPTLFFGLASLAVVAWPGTQCSWRRSILAGTFAGLAIATKVVGVFPVAAVGLVLCIRAFIEMRPAFASMFRCAVAFIAGILVPLAMVECWRWFWLGAAGYQEWWAYQITSILFQAGATATEPGVSGLAKALHHFELLAGYLSVSRAWTLGLICSPIVAVGVLYAAASVEWRARCRWWLLGLMLILGLYFPWWLGIVPTEKAWLRYIYIALMSLGMLGGIAVIGHLELAVRERRLGRRVLHAGLAGVVLVGFAPFAARSLQAPIRFGPDNDVLATLFAAKTVTALPANEMVFGFGWYAAPTVQLYVDRGFIDFTDWPVGRLQGETAYFVADRATLVTGVLKPWLDRFPHRKLMRDNIYAQVYEVSFSDPANPFAGRDLSAARSEVTDFSKTPYDLVWGMEPYDPMGGRFTESDSEILLRYDGQALLRMNGYMALPRYYRFPEPLSGRILIGDCPPIPFAFDGTGWQAFSFQLQCKPEVDTNVRVRLLFDNVFALATMYDHQRAMLLGGIGFSD